MVLIKGSKCDRTPYLGGAPPIPNAGNLGNVNISSQLWPMGLLHSPKSIKTYYISPAVSGLPCASGAEAC